MTELTVGDVKDLQAIDIFLFSNGDHNTPPRKYHLNTDAFLMWDDTLKSLGRSHFGIDDTVIDLYTISGHKIDDPSQLIHQAAYVAVKPPSPFVQTGYENYLIRATRSWEKRLLKISKSVDSSTKGNTESVLLKPQVNHEIQGRKNKETPNPAVVEKLKRSLVKPYVINLKPPQGREKTSKLPEINQVKRKKTPQIAALRQRSSPFKITSVSKKVVIKTKGDFHKKLPDVRKMVAPSTDKDLEDTTKENPDINIFPSSNITSFNVVENVTKNSNHSVKKISSTKMNHEKVEHKKNDKPTINNGKIIIANIYKNPEKEYMSLTGIKYDGASNDVNVGNKSLSYADMKYMKTCCTCGDTSRRKSIIQIENKNNIKTSEIDTNSDVPVEIQTCVNCCQKQKQINNFVAFLNNDKVLKLHLNLEIENCNLSVTSDQLNAKTHQTQACMSVIKTEKETQVNFYEQLNEDVFEDVNKTEYYPRQSDDELKNVIDDENKIVIINCSCCDCDNVHRLPQLNVKYDNSCNEDILYELASAIQANRCECRNNLLNTQQKNNASPRSIAANNYEECEEKTLRITSVQKLMCSHETNTFNDNLNIDKYPKLIVPIDEYSNQILNKTVDNSKKSVNTSTQTNWYNVMLEARRRTNGRYSFHLPPLYKIKNYNID